MKKIKALLEKKGIEPSFQRIKIYEYLLKQKNHPSVNMIYEDLSREIPTLSKTTVYNNLKIFEKENMVIRINLHDNEVRYDANTSFHGHFMCRKCGKIYDFEINNIGTNLNGEKIEERFLNYLGICKDCLEKEEDNNESKKINR